MGRRRREKPRSIMDSLIMSIIEIQVINAAKGGVESNNRKPNNQRNQNIHANIGEHQSEDSNNGERKKNETIINESTANHKRVVPGKEEEQPEEEDEQEDDDGDGVPKEGEEQGEEDEEGVIEAEVVEVAAEA